ncbi:hypothetical protein LXM25_05790 [Dyadobacter sp. LJ53]|uniref:hypothetical protein n=1 Tax=Dyadobacter chenwenxiniae TaxID=2906456 RepID=UPI001F2BC2CA|nr:hypothetical protein [Dyadobacter chenwenxiniae]MCF0049555.1 hypothetical protein [Dyadobacter chenwenxiniae]
MKLISTKFLTVTETCKWLFLILLLPCVCHAQYAKSTLKVIDDSSIKTNGAGTKFSIPVVSPESFLWAPIQNTQQDLVTNFGMKNIIKKDMETVLFGDQSPATGFVLDLSGKTTAKISGRVPAKKSIQTWEFEAGQKDNNVPILDKGKYNGIVTSGYNWHFINTKPNFKLPLPNTKYRYMGESAPIMSRIRELKVLQINQNMIDSAQALINCFLAFEVTTFKLYEDKYKKEIEMADDKLMTIEGFESFDGNTFSTIQSSVQNFNLYKSILGQYTGKDLLKDANSVDEVNTAIRQDEDFKFDLLVKDLEKSLKRLTKRPELFAESEREAAKPYWARKRLTWISISPNMILKAYKLYGKDRNNTILAKPQVRPFLSLRTNFWYSLYWVKKNSIDLLRFGIEPVIDNNFKDYTEIKYYERDTLQAEQNGNVVLTETVTDGLLRDKDSRVKYKLIWNFRVEYYLLPTRSLVPGLAAKLSWMRDGIVMSTRKKLRPQVGPVFNLVNQDKTKAAITLQPYFVYDNILRDAVKNEYQQVVSVKWKEKLGAGITIGLPIKGFLAINE